MKQVIGATFLRQCKLYYFDPGELALKRDDEVIVETAQGKEYARVVLPNHELWEEKIPGELKKVLRLVTDDDRKQLEQNRKNEHDAMRICRDRIRIHNLEMKLIRAEYTFDRSRLTFSFTADGRIDFRSLVKDLASIFRTRIELRQVGVRDETRLLGGIGACGRELCCATWLPDFAPVTIKMAKEQNLSLNSSKISGVCGRLLCCLKNEAETYEYLNAKLPDVGKEVKTSEGLTGTVKSVNVLLQRVTVYVDTGKDEREEREYHVSELTFTPSKKKEKKLAEEAELADLEDVTP